MYMYMNMYLNVVIGMNHTSRFLRLSNTVNYWWVDILEQNCDHGR
jgi:hypothetical protein